MYVDKKKYFSWVATEQQWREHTTQPGQKSFAIIIIFHQTKRRKLPEKSSTDSKYFEMQEGKV